MYRARARYLIQLIWLDTVHTNSAWRRGLWERGRGLHTGSSNIITYSVTGFGNLRTANWRTGNMRTNMRTRPLIGRDVTRVPRAVRKVPHGFAVRIVSSAGLMNLISALLKAVAFVYL